MASWKSCSPATWVSVHIVTRPELTWQFMTAPEHSWDRIEAAAHRVHTDWIILSTRVRVKVIFLFLKNGKIVLLLKYSQFKSSWTSFMLRCFKYDLNVILVHSYKWKMKEFEELWCITLDLPSKQTQESCTPKILNSWTGNILSSWIAIH